MRYIAGGVMVIGIVGVLLAPKPSHSLMSSTNYTIFADSVDTGGVFSSGGSFNLEDTIGEGEAIGFTTSSAYEVRGGYQAMDVSILTMTLSTTTLDLGELSVGLLRTAQVAVSVTTDCIEGYTVSISSISGNSISGVTDGSVSIGDEEYGVAVSGVDRAFTNDKAVTLNLTLASSSTPVTDAQTTLTFKAAIGGGTAPGTRSQSITLTGATNI